MTLPPGFVKRPKIKGLNPPHCFWCTHSANETRTRKIICWKYGAYVLLYSTCDSFERRVRPGAPELQELEINEKFRFGLNDLVH